MGLSDSRLSPACPSRASGWWSHATTGAGLPCCVCCPCRHAVVTTPADPERACCSRGLRPHTRSRRRPSLLHREVGVRERCFGAFSTFTWLRPACLLSRLQRPFSSKASADSLPPRLFRLLPGGTTNFPGGTLTRWTTAPFHGARCTTAIAPGLPWLSAKLTKPPRVAKGALARPSRGSALPGRSAQWPGSPRPGDLGQGRREVRPATPMRPGGLLEGLAGFGRFSPPNVPLILAILAVLAILAIPRPLVCSDRACKNGRAPCAVKRCGCPAGESPAREVRCSAR